MAGFTFERESTTMSMDDLLRNIKAKPHAANIATGKDSAESFKNMGLFIFFNAGPVIHDFDGYCIVELPQFYFDLLPGSKL